MKKVIFSISFLAVTMISGVANAASSLNESVKLDDVQCVTLGKANDRTDVNYGKLTYNIVVTYSLGFDAVLKDGTHVSRAGTAVDTSDDMTNSKFHWMTQADADVKKVRYQKTAKAAFENDILKKLNAAPKCLALNPAPAPGVLTADEAPAAAGANAAN